MRHTERTIFFPILATFMFFGVARAQDPYSMILGPIFPHEHFFRNSVASAQGEVKMVHKKFSLSNPGTGENVSWDRSLLYAAVPLPERGGLTVETGLLAGRTSSASLFYTGGTEIRASRTAWENRVVSLAARYHEFLDVRTVADFSWEDSSPEMSWHVECGDTARTQLVYEEVRSRGSTSFMATYEGDAYGNDLSMFLSRRRLILSRRGKALVITGKLEGWDIDSRHMIRMSSEVERMRTRVLPLGFCFRAEFSPARALSVASGISYWSIRGTLGGPSLEVPEHARGEVHGSLGQEHGSLLFHPRRNVAVSAGLSLYQGEADIVAGLNPTYFVQFPWLWRKFIEEAEWEAAALGVKLNGNHARLGVRGDFKDRFRVAGLVDRFSLRFDWDVHRWSDVWGNKSTVDQSSSFLLYRIVAGGSVSVRFAQLSYSVEQFIPGKQKRISEGRKKTYAGTKWRGGREHEVSLTFHF